MTVTGLAQFVWLGYVLKLTKAFLLDSNQNRAQIHYQLNRNKLNIQRTRTDMEMKRKVDYEHIFVYITD